MHEAAGSGLIVVARHTDILAMIVEVASEELHSDSARFGQGLIRREVAAGAGTHGNISPREWDTAILQAGMRKRSRGRRLTWWRTFARDHVIGCTATRFSFFVDLWVYVLETIDEFAPRTG